MCVCVLYNDHDYNKLRNSIYKSFRTHAIILLSHNRSSRVFIWRSDARGMQIAPLEHEKDDIFLPFTILGGLCFRAGLKGRNIRYIREEKEGPRQYWANIRVAKGERILTSRIYLPDLASRAGFLSSPPLLPVVAFPLFLPAVGP